MERQRRTQRSNAVPPLRAQPCPSWTPRINGEQDKKKSAVNWVAHWGGWRMGHLPPCVMSLCHCIAP